jgi:predicted membrane protein
MESILYNSIGLVGITLIIVAFFLLQIDKIKSTDLSYSILNLVGALFHIISLLYAFNLASLIIEIFWVAISGYGIWKFYKRRTL